jgi:nickel superoxide dismutase
MKRTSSLLLALFCVGFAARSAAAHCEVPCGIYDDQLRFESMLEDTTTIDKAMAQIKELAGKTDPQSVNQLVRWINTKEEHAGTVQHVIAQYFMTQRIKADDPQYVAKLTAAHAVMTQAMKCKQSTDPAVAADLKDKIMAFHKAYEGKK